MATKIFTGIDDRPNPKEIHSSMRQFVLNKKIESLTDIESIPGVIKTFLCTYCIIPGQLVSTWEITASMKNANTLLIACYYLHGSVLIIDNF